MSGAPSLASVAAAIPVRFAGPGGALAVLRDGAVLEAGAWGFADRERRVPFTAGTPTRVCSITKQFTCATVLRAAGDPEALAPALGSLLPHLGAERGPVRTLCHNQSGLRDYWALAMLCGAPAEGRFTEADWRRLSRGTRSLHFVPGTRYSYANGNFRLLSDALGMHRGVPFETLLRRHVLDPAGMDGAAWAAETARGAGLAVGYEGGVAEGFRPAVNRIRWTGDAALAASLDDMIAWERHIDRTRDDPDGVLGLLAGPVTFTGGADASYGFGLARFAACGRALTGHAGALRGFRSFRLHGAADRVSVVVLFNHMADPRSAALALFAAALGEALPDAVPVADAAAWRFAGLDRETGLATALAPDGAAGVVLRHAPLPETLGAAADGLAGAATRIAREGGGLRMHRPGENARSLVRTLAPPDRPPPEGVFRNAALGATLTLARSGGAAHGAFSGWLGDGAMEGLRAFGRDVWLLPCPQALDHAAPGDWTLIVERDEGGRAASITVGCWLARGIRFAAVPA